MPNQVNTVVATVTSQASQQEASYHRGAISKDSPIKKEKLQTPEENGHKY